MFSDITMGKRDASILDKRVRKYSTIHDGEFDPGSG